MHGWVALNDQSRQVPSSNWKGYTMTREEEDTNVNLGQLGYGRSTVIRSHRKPPMHSSKRKTGVVLAIVITATMISASTIETEQATPTATITAVGLSDVPTIELPQEAPEERARMADRPSRSAGRAAKPVASKIEIVIQFALAQRGDRYSWAKSGPDAYDCSGLVLRAFAQVGINLPHYTGTMINKGTRVSKADLRRGDIVFPTSGHVGIYIGDNKMVVASSGKGMVITQTVYSFYAARRIL